MKHLRKSFLTLLALTLFGGAGAWAQGPTNVTQFTTDLIASWETDNHPVTLAVLQDLGFEAVAENTAGLWTGAPQDGYSYLYYGFDGGEFYYIEFEDGNPVNQSSSVLTKSDFYHNVANGHKYFYTGSPEPAEIELTKAGANQWTLGQTPDYDLELQVEYYQKYALKDIPEGWTVKVDGVDKTAAIDGDSLMITETDTVTLIPPADVKPIVKSVTLVEPLQTVHVGGDADATLYYLPGETWGEAIQHPGNTGFGSENNDIKYNGFWISYGNEWVYTDTPVDPSAQYQAVAP